MTGKILLNEYKLTYTLNDTDNDSNEYLFEFDNIVSMESELGRGLYTEGTGNLRNVKAATNEVLFVFRKTLEHFEDSFKTLNGTYDTSWTNTEGKNEQYTANTTSSHYLKSLKGRLLNWDPNHTNLSIYKWAEHIINGVFDRGVVVVQAKIVDPTENTGIFMNFLELTDAIPLKAIIKRNPYRGVNVAELTIVADSLKVYDLDI